ncbi:efflux RND transporter permease subunit [Ectothiorhodospira lacustris]|uniref:efflux RND transporter permease subunit n=1 Tax=Ectothiorhodospira lacustris TaxID=2899127 RepID=UPI001EE9A575|nr:CusA/CzcA family heavy metal efflux RND transporter [Ectothiorhodospira lacustris]MCG5499704.1 CusA/CzcA family heavy metal efflux RND transporter [Ectothiorhodospira lacustris]
MIDRIIQASLDNRLLVLLLTAIFITWGLFSLRDMPLDAIPDLSDVQVIVHTGYPGQAPQIVEDQVTYPLSTAMLAVPGARDVRGFSMFGDSYVYVIFEDGTDPYWARSRVLEYLSQVAPDLPDGARPALGPDATGVGWVYQYALVDRSGTHDLADLRSLQDWFLKYELQSVPGVAEVATLGGMVKQYQVVLDPNRARAFDLTLEQVRSAIQAGNREGGGSVLQMAEAEYMVRTRGYLTGAADLAHIPVGRTADGTPLLLEDVAEIRLGPEARRGLADLDGEGEVVGALVVMRHGENALATIERVKQRLDALRPSLPPGVEIVETYDRSTLIRESVHNLSSKLWQEFLIIAAVSLVFLLHLRSALVAIVSLPIGILAALMIMQQQGINANIMSLGGIAVTIGAMVDAAIVMVENLHKRLERARPEEDRWALVAEAAKETGRPLFFALLIITVSFLPLFVLEGQEGRMFKPLAFTGTYAMAAAAGLGITLVPVLMGYLVRGRIRPEAGHPLSRLLIALYQPLLRLLLRHPWATVAAALLLALTMLWPGTRLGSEFMPELDEGDLMYMPSLNPGVSLDKVREFLQQTDRLIASVPEVEQVFGKAGRADTATDPAPIGMLETVIRFKPRDEWREGMTKADIIRELDAAVQFPGVANVWVPPIKTRIDMLSTGIRSPVGVKISGPDLAGIERLGREIEAVLAQVPGTASAFADRAATGRYVEVEIHRERAARHGVSVAELQSLVQTAVGGMGVTETVEGRERYPVNLRYPQDWRDSPEALEALPVITLAGAHVPLGSLATIRIVDGPAMIRTENARLNGWVVVDIRDRDLGSYVAEARRLVAEQVTLPPGYAIAWSGQYEHMERARERLGYLIPVTLVLIFLLLYLCFRSGPEALMLMGALPFAAVGGIWLVYWLGHDLSVAVAAGFILLMGLAAEFAVVMLMYIRNAVARQRPTDRQALEEAIIAGAVMRVRPKAMTSLTVVLGLSPLLLDSGPGSEAMQRIAAPVIGGMITAPLVSLLLIPVLYWLWQRGPLPDNPAPARGRTHDVHP